MFFDELVHFGKYKGQSLSSLLEDESYVEDFFLKKPDLIRKNPNIILALLAKNYPQNISLSKTIGLETKTVKDIWEKEINRMQIEYIQEWYPEVLAKYILQIPEPKEINIGKKRGINNLQFETDNCNVSFSFHKNLENDNEKSTNEIYYFRVWLIYEIGENYRKLLSHFNKLIAEKGSDNTFNIIQTEKINIDSIDEEQLKTIFKFQNIFLLTESDFMGTTFITNEAGQVVEKEKSNNIITLGSRMNDEDIPF